MYNLATTNFRGGDFERFENVFLRRCQTHCGPKGPAGRPVCFTDCTVRASGCIRVHACVRLEDLRAGIPACVHVYVRVILTVRTEPPPAITILPPPTPPEHTCVAFPSLTWCVGLLGPNEIRNLGSQRSVGPTDLATQLGLVTRPLGLVNPSLLRTHMRSNS